MSGRWVAARCCTGGVCSPGDAAAGAAALIGSLPPIADAAVTDVADFKNLRRFIRAPADAGLRISEDARLSAFGNSTTPLGMANGRLMRQLSIGPPLDSNAQSTDRRSAVQHSDPRRRVLL